MCDVSGAVCEQRVDHSMAGQQREMMVMLLLFTVVAKTTVAVSGNREDVGGSVHDTLVPGDVVQYTAAVLEHQVIILTCYTTITYCLILFSASLLGRSTMGVTNVESSVING